MSSTTSPPTQRPLRADARRNREAIVAAARALVAEHGTEAQIHDVAREAGVGVGTVYRHFPTKEALMTELVRSYLRENAQIARDARAIDDPWESFASLVRAACDSMARDAGKRRMWQIAPADAIDKAADLKEEMGTETRAVVDRAREAGVLRRDFTMEDIPGLFCGLAGVIETLDDAGWRRFAEFALDGLRVG